MVQLVYRLIDNLFGQIDHIHRWIKVVKSWSVEKAEQLAKGAIKVWDSAKGQFEAGKKTVAKALNNWYDAAKDTGKKITKKTAEFISWLTECEEQARLEGYPSLNS